MVTELERECAAVHRVFAVLGRSWAGAVVWALLDGAERYGEVRAALPGVSEAVLASRLKELCAHRLAERLVEPGPPVVVRYRLTPAGRDARPALRALRDYAGGHPEVFGG